MNDCIGLVSDVKVWLCKKGQWFLAASAMKKGANQWKAPFESCWKFADKQKLRAKSNLLAPSLLQGLVDRREDGVGGDGGAGDAVDALGAVGLDDQLGELLDGVGADALGL